MSKPLPIPQVAAIEMSDAEKAKIPPLHRLHLTPTAAEARLLQIAAAGPAAMDDPAYWAASKAVDAERGKAAAGKQKKKKQKPPS